MIGFIKAGLRTKGLLCKPKLNYNIVIYKSVSEIPADEKKHFFDESNILLSEAYLQAIEHSFETAISSIYIKVQDKITSQTNYWYGQLYEFSKAHFEQLGNEGATTTSKAKSIANSVVLNALDCLKCKVLVFGSLNYSGTIQTVSLPVFQNAFDAIKVKLDIECVVIKDQPINAARQVFDFYTIPLQPNMQLALNSDWNNFEDYLNSLSAKYKKRWNNTTNKTQELVVKTLSLNEVKANQETLYQLYLSVFNNSETTYNKVKAMHFITLKKSLGDNYLVHAWYHNNEIVAFATTLINPNCAIAEFVGYNADLNKQLKLYQTILYKYVAQGIEMKKKLVEFGRTGLEIKSTIGAQPIEYSTYIKLTNKVIHHQVASIINNLKTEAWQPRNPFK